MRKIGLCLMSAALFAAPAVAEETVLLWGDTHLHTSYSFDAFMLGNHGADPDTAYRYAKGLPVVHPGYRGWVRIDRPLDFLMVTDHAEYLGVMAGISRGDPQLVGKPLGKHFKELLDQGRGNELFTEVATMATQDPESLGPLDSEPIRRSAWSAIVDAAERHDDPGKFTTFIGWEWTSTPEGRNLHRIVFTPDGPKQALRYLPYSTLDSDKPRDLWDWLAKTAQEAGTDFVAIPHNMNVSQGSMFPREDEDGRPVDVQYARQRARWEPVAEVTQYKGDSEAHPLLSPDDEFADFEIYAHLLTGAIRARPEIGAYARTALLRGLKMQTELGLNPYKFGMIGASDSHTGLSSVQETDFQGKYAQDSVPENKSKETVPGSVGWDASAQGLAGVWAKANTREAITAAFKRKEVYATTGPRIQLRFFGGWEYAKADAEAPDLAAVGYRKGVPMGGDLANPPRDAKAPTFLVQAAKDPTDANLDRIQIVKGWLGANGKPRERIYDVTWSGNRRIGLSGKLKRVGDTVDLEAGTYENRIGSDELVTVWTDPAFDPEELAFYYARVIQIPVPRHTLYDTLALQKPAEASNHPAIIQERAYSSPIWYTPAK